jgi:dUTPase
MKLDHSACLIDSEYRDELIFCFFNNNQERVVIEPGMKITQGLIVPVINLKLQECLNCVYDDIVKSSGNRGGGFGSSGTK